MNWLVVQAKTPRRKNTFEICAKYVIQCLKVLGGRVVRNKRLFYSLFLFFSPILSDKSETMIYNGFDYYTILCPNQSHSLTA